VGDKIQHPQKNIKNIQGGVVKNGILTKKGEWSKLCTSLEYQVRKLLESEVRQDSKE